MSAVEVRRRWRVPLPLTVRSSGSSLRAEAPVCRGRATGVAFLLGLSDTARGQRLQSVWFTGGMTTDRGIGTGATLDALRRTYGTALTRDPNDPNVYRVAVGGSERNAIGFVTSDDRVKLIGFGYARSVTVPKPTEGSPDWWGLEAIRC